MKKYTIALLAFVIVGLLVYVAERQSFASPHTYTSSRITPTDSLLTIGIIGDSWVSGHSLDTILANQLSAYSIVSRISSSGHPGATSKAIYQNLFADPDEQHSSNFILSAHPKYCIVMLGVNDSQGQRSKDFYAYHLKLIVETLLKSGIKPVVVTLPRFGVEDRYRDVDPLSYARFMFFAYLNHDGVIDNIRDFRNAALVSLKPYRSQMILVDFDRVCPDYSACKDMYDHSHIHLSKKGRTSFVGELASAIARDRAVHP